MVVDPSPWLDGQLSCGFLPWCVRVHGPVFDFDDTLFFTPGPEEGRGRYAKLMGHPWPYRSWLNIPASLDPRLGISAGPAMPVLRRLYGSANTVTVLLSAREEACGEAIGSLLASEDLEVDRVCLRPSTYSDSGAWHRV